MGVQQLSSPAIKEIVMRDDSSTAQTPRPSDILCGKNKECLDHPGSVHFRLVIDQNAKRYQAADSKYMKMEITKHLYQQMCQESVRFLKFNAMTEEWHELSSSQVRDKIGHALRFANRRKRRNVVSNRQTASSSHKRSRSDDSVTTQSTASESSSDFEGEDQNGVDAMPPLCLPGASKMLPMTSHANDEYLPVTKVLRGLRNTMGDRAPPYVIFANDWEPKVKEQTQVEERELSDGDVISMMREPLMEFELKTVKPVWL